MAKDTTKKKPKKRSKGGSMETVKTAVFALAIALFIRTFFVQAFRIPSGSMEETLLVGDFLLVDKLTYGARFPGTSRRLPGFRDPRRGDIIVFKDPHTNRDFIKRVIATEGEEIRMAKNVVSIDGQAIPEPYTHVEYRRGAEQLASFGPYEVPEESLFMMGDNRNNSQDSRFWGPPERDPKSGRVLVDPRTGRPAQTQAALAEERVVGRAFVLYFSTDPERAPRWVRDMSEGWTKGFLQLFLGRPRVTRLGKWLAKDYTDVYAQGVDGGGEAPIDERRPGAPGAAEAAEVAPEDTAASP